MVTYVISLILIMKTVFKSNKKFKNKNLTKIEKAQKYAEKFSILSHNLNLQKILD